MLLSKANANVYLAALIVVSPAAGSTPDAAWARPPVDMKNRAVGSFGQCAEFQTYGLESASHRRR